MSVRLNNIYCRKEPVSIRGRGKNQAVLSESERDSARIIHSAAFRRLQNKMQVQFIGDSDYYRTRLTHTLEVMQIARGIYYHLHKSIDNELGEYKPNIHLIEAICFAHDIGHPPFGHAGEVALNECMKKFGGFEGNAQTLHILTKGDEHSQTNGFNLMRRTLLGVIKYPVTYSVLCNARHNSKPPKCIYNDEDETLSWILEVFDENDQREFKQFTTQQDGHSKSKYKSFDCSIMNMADDIAYACHDLEDAIKLNFLTRDKVQKVLEDRQYRDSIDFLFTKIKSDNQEYTIETFINALYSEAGNKLFFSKLIDFFIKGCTINKNPAFNHPLLQYNICFSDEKYEKVLKILKDELTFKNVISHYKILQMEYKGQKMIQDVFNAFVNRPDKILPYNVQNKYEQCSNDLCKRRVICDYIAGMSDNFLVKIYSRLFMPNHGSIGDLL